MEINGIIGTIKNGDFRFSLHAIEMMLKRRIDEEEVEEVVITTYEPDPAEWINCKVRRK